MYPSQRHTSVCCHRVCCPADLAHAQLRQSDESKDHMLTLLAQADADKAAAQTQAAAAAATAAAASASAASSSERQQQQAAVAGDGGSSAAEQQLRSQLQVGDCQPHWIQFLQVLPQYTCAGPE